MDILSNQAPDRSTSEGLPQYRRLLYEGSAYEWLTLPQPKEQQLVLIRIPGTEKSIGYIVPATDHIDDEYATRVLQKMWDALHNQ